LCVCSKLEEFTE
jgi:hypothetical protein